jgi:hypothetical protein
MISGETLGWIIFILSSGYVVSLFAVWGIVTAVKH